MTKISIGSKAPNFTLETKDGNNVSLNSVKSTYTVVYFYPKDDTPGCTIEAKEFNDSLAAFNKIDAQILGISGGDNKSKAKFCTKYKLKVTLLSDTDFKVAKSYDCYGKKKFMGREYMGIFRKTFLLNSEKKVIAIFNEVTPKGHAKEILTTIAKGVPSKRPNTPVKTAPKSSILKKGANAKKVTPTKKGAKPLAKITAKPKAQNTSKKVTKKSVKPSQNKTR